MIVSFLLVTTIYIHPFLENLKIQNGHKDVKR